MPQSNCFQMLRTIVMKKQVYKVFLSTWKLKIGYSGGCRCLELGLNKLSYFITGLPHTKIQKHISFEAIGTKSIKLQWLQGRRDWCVMFIEISNFIETGQKRHCIFEWSPIQSIVMYSSWTETGPQTHHEIRSTAPKSAVSKLFSVVDPFDYLAESCGPL